jgi:hypothetical protein
MRKIISYLLILLFSFSLIGCESSTPYGSCVGITDDRDPNLIYKTSVRNAILGIVFVEMLFPTVIWLASETSCPVGQKMTNNSEYKLQNN